MIRLSASLVVVALGLLVAGGVTSKLLLVYVAIAVSVIALIFLIIGAILSRGELRTSSPAKAPGDRLDEGSAGRLDRAPAGDREEAATGRPDRVVAGVPRDDLTRRPDQLDETVAWVPGEAPMARPDAAPPGRRGETPAAGPGAASAGWADQAQQADAATADRYAGPDSPPPGPSGTSSAQQVDAATADRYAGPDSPPPGPSGTSSAVDTSGPEGTGSTGDTKDTGGTEDLAGTQSADQPVTVVPGVPRYHRSDCILIRFMGDGDLQKMPVEAAKKNGCTPCRACHTDGGETG